MVWFFDPRIDERHPAFVRGTLRCFRHKNSLHRFDRGGLTNSRDPFRCRMAASPCGNHLAREGRLARASALLLMHNRYLIVDYALASLLPFGNCNIVALVCPAVNWRRAVSYKRASPLPA